jgi:replicative DNA helicase
MAKNLLPSDHKAEMALLGSICLSPNAVMPSCIEQGVESYFHNKFHAIAYDILKDMYLSGEPIDCVTLTHRIMASGQFPQYLWGKLTGDIATAVVTHYGFESYISILREKYVARKAIEIGGKLTAIGNDITKTPEDVVSLLIEAERELTKHSSGRGKTLSAKQAVKLSIDKWEEISRRKEKFIPGILSGIPSLDNTTRGWRAKQMIAIGARTKGGKSALAMQFAVAACKLSEKSVGYISAEMSVDQLTDRAISQEARVDLAKMTEGGWTKAELDAIRNAAAAIAKTKLYFRESYDLSACQFQAIARQMVNDHGCSLLIVDYLQLMRGDSRDMNREQEVSSIGRAIKTTAAELEIPIIVLIQLNKDGVSRESSAVEMHSDVVINIEYKENKNDEEEGNEVDCFLRVKYNRDGANPKIPVRFIKNQTRFEERFF